MGKKKHSAEKKIAESKNRKKTDPAAEVAANPFERRVSKPKFSILGKQLKDTERNVGQARSKAIDKRRKSLLFALERQGKANKFVDNRLEEQNESISQDEKALIRFQKEAQRRFTKRSKFAIDGDDEDDLTHMGVSLGAMSDFNDDYFGSDDEEGGRLNNKYVSDLNFGGFQKHEGGPRDNETGDQNDNRTRQEILQDIIAKSKANKYAQQKEKREQEELVDKLDSEFADLQELLAEHKRPPKALRDIDPDNDEYARTVRELTFEARAAKATDRLKTPEEIALEEKEKLDQLERDRLRRMREADEEMYPKKRLKTDKPKILSGDAFDDDHLISPFGLKKATGDEEVREFKVPDVEEADSEEDEEETEEQQNGDTAENEVDEENDIDNGEENSEGEDDEDDGDELSSDLEDNEVPADHHEKFEDEAEDEELVPTKSLHISAKAASQEIPYAIEAPATYADFLKLVENRLPQDIATIIQRIRTYNHASINQANGKKLEGFLAILFKYFASLCRECASMASLDVLCKPLFEMSQQSSEPAKTAAREKIKALHGNFVKRLQGGKVAWPSYGDLVYFKMIAILFPTSDFLHSVVTPAVLLLNQYLNQSPVKTPKDVMSGLFVCNLVLHYLESAKRYSPEVTAFLRGVLDSALGHKPSLHTILAKVAKLPDTKNDKWQPKPFEFECLAKPNSDDVFKTADFNLSVLWTALMLIKKAADIYSENEGFPDVFSAFDERLTQIASFGKLPKAIKELVESLKKFIAATSEKVMRNRMPMKTKPKAVKSIQSFNPRFGTRVTAKGVADPDRDREALQKLKRKAKKEERGAMRELRKDNWFVATEQAKKRKAEDLTRKEKGNKIMAELEMQQHQGKVEKNIKRKQKSKRF